MNIRKIFYVFLLWVLSTGLVDARGLYRMTVNAQIQLTSEEISFLKSLTGKWSEDSNSDGSHTDDFSILYVNGSLKISHPKEITMGGGRCMTKKGVVTTNYDKSSRSVSFSFKVRIINTDDIKRGDSDFWDDIYVQITIPFQEGIEDMMIVNYYRKHLDINMTFSDEKVYYKI